MIHSMILKMMDDLINQLEEGQEVKINGQVYHFERWTDQDPKERKIEIIKCASLYIKMRFEKEIDHCEYVFTCSLDHSEDCYCGSIGWDSTLERSLTEYFKK